MHLHNGFLRHIIANALLGSLKGYSQFRFVLLHKAVEVVVVFVKDGIATCLYTMSLERVGTGVNNISHVVLQSPPVGIGRGS